MKLKIAVLTLILGLLVVPGASAMTTFYSCINDTHMLEEANLVIDGTKYQINQTMECAYDCSDIKQQCNDNPSEASPWGFIPIAIMFPLFSFIFVYISLNVGKKHSILGWFFIPFSMIMMMIGIFSLIEYENSMNIKNILSTSGFGIIIALIVFISYFMLWFIFNMIGKMQKDEPYGDNLRE